MEKIYPKGVLNRVLEKANKEGVPLTFEGERIGTVKAIGEGGDSAITFNGIGQLLSFDLTGEGGFAMRALLDSAGGQGSYSIKAHVPEDYAALKQKQKSWQEIGRGINLEDTYPDLSMQQKIQADLYSTFTPTKLKLGNSSLTGTPPFKPFVIHDTVQKTAVSVDMEIQTIAGMTTGEIHLMFSGGDTDVSHYRYLSPMEGFKPRLALFNLPSVIPTYLIMNEFGQVVDYTYDEARLRKVDADGKSICEVKGNVIWLDNGSVTYNGVNLMFQSTVCDISFDEFHEPKFFVKIHTLDELKETHPNLICANQQRNFWLDKLDEM